MRTHESLYSTLDEKYDAIACDFPPKLEFLLAYESHTVVPICSLDTFEEEYKAESEVFNLLKIDVYVFTYDTPLGTIFDEFSRLSSMEDDLFTYEVGVLEPSYFPCVEQPYDDLENDIKFGNHKKVDKEIKEGVVATWLIRSYRKQFKEYMEIKRLLEVDGVNTDLEFDQTNVEGDDEEVLTSDKLSDLKEENLREGNEIAEIFRRETDIFLFETPLCKAFKEFNHLLQIDVDVLTRDLPGFKTYEDYKNTWYYEWNNEVSWVDEKPWLKDGI
ncbi:hypothetical protein Tco_1202861 [Tanacetum coccineum]